MANNVTTQDKATVATPCKAHQDMCAKWTMIDHLRGGTQAMRDAGETYLPRETDETLKAYDVRLNRSFLFPALARTIKGLVGKVFAKPVLIEPCGAGEAAVEAARAKVDVKKEEQAREQADQLAKLNGKVVPIKKEAKKEPPEEAKVPMLDPDVAAWLENVDLSGRDVQAFARDLFDDAVTAGLTHIHVDYPVVEKGATLADEKKGGGRPYLRHIKAADVIGWWSNTVNGEERLTEIRIKEVARVRDGEWGEKFVNRVRVLRIGSWELWEQGSDEKWSMKESGTVTGITDRVPIITVYTGRTGFMVAEPPLMGLAWLNVCHWQSSSDQRNILRVARVPFIFAAGVREGELGENVSIGSNRMIAVKDPEASMQFVEHTGAAIGAGKIDLDDLKEEMAMVGLELLAKRMPGNQTATEKTIDTAEMNSSLAIMAHALGEGLEDAIQTMCEWAKKSKQDIAVKVNTDFGISGTDQAILTTLVAARTSGDISRETFWTELRRRGILSEDFDFEMEEVRLDDEGAKMPPPVPGGFGGQPPPDVNGDDKKKADDGAK